MLSLFLYRFLFPFRFLFRFRFLFLFLFPFLFPIPDSRFSRRPSKPAGNYRSATTSKQALFLLFSNEKSKRRKNTHSQTLLTGNLWGWEWPTTDQYRFDKTRKLRWWQCEISITRQIDFNMFLCLLGPKERKYSKRPLTVSHGASTALVQRRSISTKWPLNRSREVGNKTDSLVACVVRIVRKKRRR